MNKLGKFIVIESNSVTVKKEIVENLSNQFSGSHGLTYHSVSDVFDKTDTPEIEDMERSLFFQNGRSNILFAESLLSDVIEDCIMPELIAGGNVIVDAYDQFIMANCIHVNDEELFNFFFKINDEVIGICKPTLRVYLNVVKDNPDISDEEEEGCLKQKYNKYYTRAHLCGGKLVVVDVLDSSDDSKINALIDLSVIVGKHLNE